MASVFIEVETAWAAERFVEVWEAKDGWRWRRKMKRGRRIVAESGEAYKRQNKAVEAAQRENPGLTVRYPEA